MVKKSEKSSGCERRNGTIEIGGNLLRLLPTGPPQSPYSGLIWESRGRVRERRGRDRGGGMVGPRSTNRCREERIYVMFVLCLPGGRFSFLGKINLSRIFLFVYFGH